jgi:transposase
VDLEVESIGDASFIEAVFFILHTGTAWADLPDEFGRWETARRRYRRWAGRGVCEQIFLAISPNNDCPATLLVDNTACEVHRSGLGDSEAAIGKTRAGHNTKIHAAIEPDGTIRSLVLTAGNEADSLTMSETLGGLRPLRVVADKGYDTNRCRDEVRAAGAVPVIPSKCTSRIRCPVRRKTYAGRHVVENFFARLKDFCRVTLRRDKSDDSYWGFVMFAAALLNMRRGWTTVLLA